VIEQAAGLALLSALSPTALLVAAAYLGSARPRPAALCGRRDHPLRVTPGGREDATVEASG
jgi:hypothetical protein